MCVGVKCRACGYICGRVVAATTAAVTAAAAPATAAVVPSATADAAAAISNTATCNTTASPSCGYRYGSFVRVCGFVVRGASGSFVCNKACFA